MMTLTQCTIELLNVAVSDTTDDDSSNAAKYIIIQLYFKELFIQKTNSPNKLTALKKIEKKTSST